MDLSIVIIAKNEERLLPRLLKSIAAQDFTDYELILSDADSKDRTREIARSFGCRIVKGGLPSIGRNNGAKAAKSDLILFLDSDVVLPKGFLSSTVAEFKRRKLDCATTDYQPLSDRKVDKTLFLAYNLWQRGTQYFIPHSGGFCIFCTKRLWRKAKGFPERILLGEDHAFVAQVKKAGGTFRVLKSKPILVDVRRLDREGRFRLVRNLSKAMVIRILKGDQETPYFSYTLHGHDTDVRVLHEKQRIKHGKRKRPGTTKTPKGL